MAGIDESRWPPPSERPGFSHHPIWAGKRRYVEARTGGAEPSCPLPPGSGLFGGGGVDGDCRTFLWRPVARHFRKIALAMGPPRKTPNPRATAKSHQNRVSAIFTSPKSVSYGADQMTLSYSFTMPITGAPLPRERRKRFLPYLSINCRRGSPFFFEPESSAVYFVFF